MVINKQTGSTPVTLNLANFTAGGAAQAWQINSATQTAIARLADVGVSSNAIAATVPSQSITLFVVPAGQTAPPPSTPPAGGSSSSSGGGGAVGGWVVATLGLMLLVRMCWSASAARIGR
jgi:hypothetical protein